MPDMSLVLLSSIKQGANDKRRIDGGSKPCSKRLTTDEPFRQLHSSLIFKRQKLTVFVNNSLSPKTHPQTVPKIARLSRICSRHLQPAAAENSRLNKHMFYLVLHNAARVANTAPRNYVCIQTLVWLRVLATSRVHQRLLPDSRRMVSRYTQCALFRQKSPHITTAFWENDGRPFKDSHRPRVSTWRSPVYQRPLHIT